MVSEITVRPEDWTEAITDVDGTQLVVGGPGSGKTEFLVRRARHLISSNLAAPEEVLVLTFSRRGAADLRTRIGSGLGSISGVGAVTFHSLAMRILESHGSSGQWPSVPTLLTGPEHVELVGEVLAGEDPANWPQPFRSILNEPAFADEVADFVLRAAERLEDSASIAARNRADWRGLPGFLNRYRSTLIERGRIDYGSLQVEAAHLLDDPTIRNQLLATIEFVLVDEYQDTTFAQAALLERVAGRGNITVAGDPYQSVYSFRGAELSNVADFMARFARPDREPPRRVILNTSFRVPAAILDAAVRVTTGGGLPGAAGPMHPAAGTGSVETYAFDQHSEEADWLASEIQRVHLRDRTPYGRIAVLVRSKRRFLPELSRALERRGIPHDRPDARLVDHPAVRPVLDLVRAASLDGSEADSALRRVLLGPLVGLSLAAARQVERQAVESGWTEALTAAAVVPDLIELLADPSWATSASAADGFWRVWSTLEAFTDMVRNPARSHDRRAVASFSQALSRMAERDPGATLSDYAQITGADDFEATPLLEYASADERVTLTTLHQSKGRSFDVVFIADARDGVFPDLRVRDSLLRTRNLSPTAGTDDAAYASFRLQEERRLAYSAMCRATRRVVWTCSEMGFDDGEGMPSRFLPLVAGTEMEAAAQPPLPWSEPTTPLEAEAWLRRSVADPTVQLVDRLAAITGLVSPAAWRPRDPHVFAGMRSRGSDRGLIGPHPMLSASQADSYLRCPRRYAFERRLRVDQGGSVYQTLGSVVHAALERAERRAMANGTEHAAVDEALSALDELFEPEAFGTPSWADAWKRRASKIMTRLYDLWPGAGPAVSLEHEFRVSHGGTQWTGRIDRVERRGDGLWVVDYKTGTSVATTTEAAVSIQLGLYVIGARATFEEPVVGAEFWYPAVGMGGNRKSVATRRLDLSRLDAVADALNRAAAGITSQDWPALPSPTCNRCPVRLVCPEWPEGQEAFLP